MEAGKEIQTSTVRTTQSVWKQAVVFTFCFLCMAARHWTLEAWAMVIPNQTKRLTSKDLKFSGTALGTLDTVYLLSYALGSYASGNLGDRYSRVKVVTVGLTIACTALSLAIAAGYYHCASLPLFILLWVFNGGGQSTVWSGTVGIMGNWFSKEIRGSVFGFWSSNSSAGNILGSQVAGFLMSRNVSWEFIMFLSVIGLFLTTLLFFLLVSDKPGAAVPSETTSMLGVEEKPESVSLGTAWNIAG